MEKKKNINNFDYQTIVIKKDKQEEMIKNYECFGWAVRQINQHKRYDNLVEVEFERNHFIKNKDDLQFLQVGMECDVNNLGRIERTRKLRSVIFVLGLCALALASLVIAIVLLINAQEVGVAWGFAMLVVAVAVSIITVAIEKKIAQNEKKLVAEKTVQYKKSIEDYLSSARGLLGGGYGKEV